MDHQSDSDVKVLIASARQLVLHGKPTDNRQPDVTVSKTVTWNEQTRLAWFGRINLNDASWILQVDSGSYLPQSCWGGSSWQTPFDTLSKEPFNTSHTHKVTKTHCYSRVYYAEIYHVRSIIAILPISTNGREAPHPRLFDFLLHSVFLWNRWSWAQVFRRTSHRYSWEKPEGCFLRCSIIFEYRRKEKEEEKETFFELGFLFRRKWGPSCQCCPCLGYEAFIR